MDQQLRIKTYTPDASSYAPRIRNEQWDQYRPLLKYLHDEGRKRAEMLHVLHEQGFTPSMGQLNAKMTSWGFKVYATQSEIPVRPIQTDFLGVEDTAMASTPNAHVYISPVSGGSTSASTLCDAETMWNAVSTSTYGPLNRAIVTEGLASMGTYQPQTNPADFGLKLPIRADMLRDQDHSAILSVGDFLSAVHCFEAAFDLYYTVFENQITGGYSEGTRLVQTLVRCAMSATTNSQCNFIMPIVRTTLGYCDSWAISDLTHCLATLLHDLGGPPVKCETPLSPGHTRTEHLPLLLVMDPNTGLIPQEKERLQHRLSQCDETCSTLVHASSWCQDTLNFYRSENQTLGKSTSKAIAGYLPEMKALEHEFQALASALIIDYLNSPGPSMKKATAECKETECIFRSGLSPCISLVVMAHLLLEPSAPPAYFESNTYLRTRAEEFSKWQWTTPSEELKAFARATSTDRCSAFVDTFLKQFSTTLAFRRFTTGVQCNWDRSWAAKRFASILQGSKTDLLPHAGLPSARRAVLKTIVAPFRDDVGLADNRHSIASEGSGSMRDFQRLALRADRGDMLSGTKTPSDAMSIDTRSSWSFHKVTGFSRGSISGAASLSSLKGDSEELEEYRQFIKSNNYFHG